MTPKYFARQSVDFDLRNKPLAHVVVYRSSEVDDEGSPPIGGGRRCVDCGSPIPDGSKYCPSCGREQ